MEYRNKTHTNRWVSAESYNENWKKRTIALMDLFRKNEYSSNSNYKVAEFGCGVYAPFYTLFNGKSGFDVLKFDIKKWDEDTTVIDFNTSDFVLPSVNISVFSGVLEYLNDIPSTLRKAMKRSDYLLVSYAFVPSALYLDEYSFLTQINRRAVSNGWRNHYSNKDMVEIISTIGVISAVGTWNKNHSLFLVRNFEIDKLKGF